MNQKKESVKFKRYIRFFADKNVLREKKKIPTYKFHGLINKSAEYVPDYTQNKL